MSKGYRIVVISPKDAFTAKLISEGIEYKEIDIFNYGVNPIDELRLLKNLIRAYREIRPQLIFHYTIKPNIYGTFAARYCGIPSIIITTGLGHLFEFKNWFVSRFTVLMYRIACHFSKEVWFLNSNDLDIFVYKGIVRRSKTHILKSEGINLHWFQPEAIVRKTYKTIFLFAGRILRDKGVLEFVKAAEIIKKKYNNVEFQIMGFIDQSNPNSIPYSEILQWQQRKIISYLGETTDVRPTLSKCDCLIFPSYYREGVSRILMEASAMEKPIITTDNVGCREVVDNGINGFLIKPKNLEQLVNTIESFISMSASDRLIMGKAGRNKMLREFDESLVFEKYENVINEYFQIADVHKNKNKIEV